MRNLRVGLLWHSLNSGNLGIGALTVGNVALAREAAAKAGVDLTFVVMGARDRHVASVGIENAEVLPIDRRNLFTSRAYIDKVGQLDCVLDIGGGDSWAEIYGPKRFTFLLVTKMIAMLRGVPLLFSPQTIGPFEKRSYRTLAAAAMRRATLVVARDPKSFAVAGAMAPRTPRLLTTDVAFRLPFQRRPRVQDGRIHIGVNVSGLLWKQSEDGTNRYGLGVDYATLMRRLLTVLIARPDTAVHLVTHAVDSRNAMDDDGHVADLLADEFAAAHRVPDFADPSEAKSYISGFDFVIAARMHACIAAFSAGVPVLPVAYSRKFSGLFEGVLNYPSVLPITGLSEDEALTFILDRLERRDDMARQIEAGNREVGVLLDAYVDALADLFRSLPVRA